MFIVSIAVFLSGKNFDLVSEDYYMQSVNYDQVIDAKRAAAALEEKPEVMVDQKEKDLLISFPNSYANQLEKASIKFFKPDDASQDFEIALENLAGSHFKVSYKDLKTGNWKVSTYWKMNEKQYIVEQNVLLK